MGKIFDENILDQLRVHDHQSGGSAQVVSNERFALVLLVHFLRPLHGVVFQHKLWADRAKYGHRLDEFYAQTFPVAEVFSEESVCQKDQQAEQGEGDFYPEGNTSKQPQHFLKLIIKPSKFLHREMHTYIQALAKNNKCNNSNKSLYHPLRLSVNAFLLTSGIYISFRPQTILYKVLSAR